MERKPVKWEPPHRGHKAAAGREFQVCKGWVLPRPWKVTLAKLVDSKCVCEKLSQPSQLAGESYAAQMGRAF